MKLSFFCFFMINLKGVLLLDPKNKAVYGN